VNSFRYPANAAEQLVNAAGSMGISLDEQRAASLLSYLELMLKWNRTYNLTAVVEPQRMITHHVLDSLSVIPYLIGISVLDVGTGAGLPGLPVAIADPAREVTLLDSNKKKTRFVSQALIELGIKNARVVTARFEDFAPAQTFDTVVTRAMTEAAQFLPLARRFCPPGGRVIMMKGQYPTQELAQAQSQAETLKVIEVVVPTLDAQRHLVISDV